MRLAKVLGGLGRVLIWSGVLVLLFVAYQLWGTNLAEARAQGDLEDEFSALLSTTTTSTSTTTTTIDDEDDDRATTTTTTTPAPPPPPAGGDAIARIVIPAIGVDKIVVEGVARDDLKKGPGHYPHSPLPGQPGNAAIAGHRTTYGAPFERVDELDPGDEILVTTLQGTFRYEVAGTRIVAPSQVDVVDDQGDDRLTLTSCHPMYSARERIVVWALLADDPAPAPRVTVPEDDADDDASAELPDEPTEPEPEEPVEAAELDSLDGTDQRTAGPAVRWGAITAGAWLAFYVLSRTWRRWPAYLLGAPVFGVCLFVFFGAFSELLPSNF